MKTLFLILCAEGINCKRLLNDEKFKRVSKKIGPTLRYGYVESTKMRSLLRKANIVRLPVLILETTDGRLEVEGVGNVITVLENVSRQFPTYVTSVNGIEVYVRKNNGSTILEGFDVIVDDEGDIDKIDTSTTLRILTRDNLKEKVIRKLELENSSRVNANA